jgi:hypothetical protein
LPTPACPECRSLVTTAGASSKFAAARSRVPLRPASCEMSRNHRSKPGRGWICAGLGSGYPGPALDAAVPLPLGRNGIAESAWPRSGPRGRRWPFEYTLGVGWSPVLTRRRVQCLVPANSFPAVLVEDQSSTHDARFMSEASAPRNRVPFRDLKMRLRCSPRCLGA